MRRSRATYAAMSKLGRGSLAAVMATSFVVAGCGGDDESREHAPSLLATEAQRDEVVARLDDAPYAAILEIIEARAAQAYEEPELVWDHRTIGHNNEMAQANAVLAWLHGDEAAAAKARDALLAMPTDFETNLTWDVNIRMPHVLIPYCIAYDLLLAGGHLTPEQAADAERRVTAVTSKFFDKYLEDAGLRQLVLGVSQNNHPIRTASAIGFVGIAFPDHPEAAKWSNWAISELDYLLGPNGRYVQPDGGISEGPFYYGFAFGPAAAISIALENKLGEGAEFARDCRNRQLEDPWMVEDCVDGETFTFGNLLRDPLFLSTLDWTLNLRMPMGWRAPIADGNFIQHPGGVLTTSFGGGGHHRWDFDMSPAKLERTMTFGMDLTAHHLFYIAPEVEGVEPPWHNRFMPDAGNAVFRSGWDEDARWLLLVAESGPARKTLHDHVDGTSFTLAAYGEYLLVDPGYYKPNDLDNAVTADADSHNVILIDGQGAPDKGLLTDFGDEDAFLMNTLDGELLAHAEAHQSYAGTDIERSVTFVRQRYFVVADRLTTSETATREHAWRLGGWAGFDIEGVFEPLAAGARWEREKAGVFVHLAATQPGLTIVEPPYEPLAAPHVGAFDAERNVLDHGVIDGVVTGVAPRFLAVLAPYRVGDDGEHGPMTVTAIDAGADATAWWIETAEGTEVAWLREPGSATQLTLPNGAVLDTDADLVVVDAGGAFGLVAAGATVSIDGSVVDVEVP